MKHIFFFFIGFGFSVLGFSYIILYMNLFSIGYKFIDYVNFIIRRIECYYSIIGIIIMILSNLCKGEKYNDKYL